MPVQQRRERVGRPASRRRSRQTQAKSSPSMTDPIRGIEQAIGRAKLRPIATAMRRVDSARLDELTQLLQDDLRELVRTKPNRLLQRNVWPVLDLIALELDRVALMPALQAAFPSIKEAVRIEDDAVVQVIWKHLLKFLGLNEKGAAALGLTWRDMGHTAAEVQSDLRRAQSYRRVAAKGLTFEAAVRNACARPIQIFALPWWAKLTGLVLIGVAIAIWKAAAGPPPNWKLFAFGAFVMLIGIVLLVNC